MAISFNACEVLSTELNAQSAANKVQLLLSPQPVLNLISEMGLLGNIQAQGLATWGSAMALPLAQRPGLFALNQSE